MTALRGDVHHTIYGRITGDVRQEPCQDIPTKHTLSKPLDILFSEAYHLEVPVYVMLAESPEVSAYRRTTGDNNSSLWQEPTLE